VQVKIDVNGDSSKIFAGFDEVVRETEPPAVILTFYTSCDNVEDDTIDIKFDSWALAFSLVEEMIKELKTAYNNSSERITDLEDFELLKDIATRRSLEYKQNNPEQVPQEHILKVVPNPNVNE